MAFDTQPRSGVLRTPRAPTARTLEGLPVIQPDGRASLAARRSYLRRQRSGRTAVVLWLAFGVVLVWLGVVGMVGLAH